jgi:hypothetical protein
MTPPLSANVAGGDKAAMGRFLLFVVELLLG